MKLVGEYTVCVAPAGICAVKSLVTPILNRAAESPFFNDKIETFTLNETIPSALVVKHFADKWILWLLPDDNLMGMLVLIQLPIL